jgi:hypothetical protein
LKTALFFGMLSSMELSVVSEVAHMSSPLKASQQYLLYFEE